MLVEIEQVGDLGVRQLEADAAGVELGTEGRAMGGERGVGDREVRRAAVAGELGRERNHDHLDTRWCRGQQAAGREQVTHWEGWVRPAGLTRVRGSVRALEIFCYAAPDSSSPPVTTRPAGR